MPLHDFQCAIGHITERFVPQGTLWVPCEVCGLLGSKVFLQPPMVAPDYQGYYSPVSGKWIEGKRARIEDLKQTGCRPYEEGEKEEYLKRRAKEEAAFDASLDRTIDQTISEMPVQKRERLQAEMDAGLTAVVGRSSPDMSQSNQAKD